MGSFDSCLLRKIYEKVNKQQTVVGGIVPIGCGPWTAHAGKKVIGSNTPEFGY